MLSVKKKQWRPTKAKKPEECFLQGQLCLLMFPKTFPCYDEIKECLFCFFLF